MSKKEDTHFITHNEMPFTSLYNVTYLKSDVILKRTRKKNKNKIKVNII